MASHANYNSSILTTPRWTTLNPSTGTTYKLDPRLEAGERFAAIFVPTFFGIIFCVGLFGNSLVITVMTKIHKVNGQRLNNTNRFILNLAVSDLLFLCFCIPFHATTYAVEGWRFGGFLCVFTKLCEEITRIASIYTLVALSVDRFLAVVYATSARQIRTKANALRGIIFIWIAAVGLATPTLFTQVYVLLEGEELCAFNDSLHWAKWHSLCLVVFGYVLPLLTIIGCYTGLLYVMCRTAKKSSVTVSNSSNDSRKKVTKIVILVVIVFAINWLPNQLMTIWMLFFQTSFVTAIRTSSFIVLIVRLLSHCMAYSNSCVNPLIYAFVSKKFRQDFKRAFTCQYISEAVGSVKAFSRRMIVTVRYSTQSSSNSNADGQLEEGSVKKNRAGVSKATYKKQKYCPRSPLTPLVSLPDNKRDQEVTDDEGGSPITRITGLPSVAVTTNCEQTALIDESEYMFGEEYEEESPNL